MSASQPHSLSEAEALAQLRAQIARARPDVRALRRILTAAFLELPTAFEKSEPPYLRVLGIGEKGADRKSVV